MSASYGFLGEWEGPGVAERILEVRAKAEAESIAAGLIGPSVEDSVRRRDQGFSMVGLGADMSLLIRAMRENNVFKQSGSAPCALYSPSCTGNDPTVC